MPSNKTPWFVFLVKRHILVFRALHEDLLVWPSCMRVSKSTRSFCISKGSLPSEVLYRLHSRLVQILLSGKGFLLRNPRLSSRFRDRAHFFVFGANLVTLGQKIPITVFFVRSLTGFSRSRRPDPPSLLQEGGDYSYLEHPATVLFSSFVPS